MEDFKPGPLETAFVAYNECVQTMQDLLAENAEVFEQWFALVEDMNTANESVRTHLREAEYDNIGGFRRVSSTKEVLDVDLLCSLFPAAATLDGLIITERKINKPVLEGYILDGTIPQSIVDQATTKTERVQVRGPITIKGLKSL